MHRLYLADRQNLVHHLHPEDPLARQDLEPLLGLEDQQVPGPRLRLELLQHPLHLEGRPDLVHQLDR